MRASIVSSLTRHGHDVAGVFDLLGWRENDLTAALAYTLARSNHLTSRLLTRLGIDHDGLQVIVRTETADGEGRTDLELVVGSQLVVIEAKRGWQLPTRAQLARYVARIVDHGAGRLVTLSDTSSEYFAATFAPSVAGVEVTHHPWSDVKADLTAARRVAGGAERVWLNELDLYLLKAVRVTDPASGWAYCVVVSNDTPGGGATTFREFVVDHATYLHPYGWGKGWPVEPPNFMALRWDGHVQQIRRVTASKVIPSLTSMWSSMESDEETTRPHLVYSLGAHLPLPAPLPSGTNYRAARPWVLIDQLLTCPTLKEAITESKRLTDRSG